MRLDRIPRLEAGVLALGRRRYAEDLKELQRLQGIRAEIARKAESQRAR